MGITEPAAEPRTSSTTLFTENGRVITSSSVISAVMKKASVYGHERDRTRVTTGAGAGSRRRYHAIGHAVGAVRRLEPRVPAQVVRRAVDRGRDAAGRQRRINAAHHVGGARPRPGAGGDAGVVRRGGARGPG